MATTAPSDVVDWIPDVISAAWYDRMDDPQLTLTGLAEKFGDVTGKPGDKLRIATDTVTSPASNLAVDVPATDDKLAGSSFTVTVKEGVKSIAWYDRTQVQSGVDVNQLAGRKVGRAMEERVELDLGAALYAGRNATKDAAWGGGATIARILAAKSEIPARLRRRGVVMVCEDAVMNALYADPLVMNAATFGSDEVIRNGQFSRPLGGVTPFVVDDGVLPALTVGGTPGPAVAFFARGMLMYGFQKNPGIETERDARARLTRHVGTMLHVEGTLETAGIVFKRAS